MLLLEFAEDFAWERVVWTRRFIVYALDHSCVFFCSICFLEDELLNRSTT